MLGGLHVFYFYFYFTLRSKIISENVRKPINKKWKAWIEVYMNKYNLYIEILISIQKKIIILIFICPAYLCCELLSLAIGLYISLIS